MQPTVRMVQTSRHRWQLLSPNNNIMVDDILCQSPHKAEEWVKSYISSFPRWDYVIIPKGGINAT